MYKNLLIDKKDRTALVTVNREKSLNAVNVETVTELASFFKEAASDNSIKTIVLTGAGSKSFVAGADITEFTDLSPEEAEKFAVRGQQMTALIEACPKPVVAAVNGYALGGGCEIAMACHFRFASPNAMFGQPEIKLGIIPGYGGTQRLTRLIGIERSLDLMLTARSITAEEALQFGLISRIIPQEELIEKSLAFCESINRMPMAAIKGIMKSAAAAWSDDGYKTEAAGFRSAVDTNDFKEGASAFLEKRKPSFSDQ